MTETRASGSGARREQGPDDERGSRGVQQQRSEGSGWRRGAMELLGRVTERKRSTEPVTAQQGLFEESPGQVEGQAELGSAPRERAERERAERERAERERAEREQTDREQAEREQAERAKALRERAEREQAELVEREKNSRQRAERERAERRAAEPPPSSEGARSVPQTLGRTEVETPEVEEREPVAIGAPSNDVASRIATYLHAPGTPAIVRAAVVAEALALPLEAVQSGLAQVSHHSEGTVAPIRPDVYLVKRVTERS